MRDLRRTSVVEGSHRGMRSTTLARWWDIRLTADGHEHAFPPQRMGLCVISGPSVGALIVAPSESNDLGQMVGDPAGAGIPIIRGIYSSTATGVMKDISAMLRPGPWVEPDRTPPPSTILVRSSGAGSAPTAHYHAFLLTPPGQPTPATPLFPSVTPVPEPASWATFALASLFMLGRFRRRATGVVTGQSPGRDARD